MKVLDVYSKKDLDSITYKGNKISFIMDDFFKRFPLSYRENYDKNLETLEIQRVDSMVDDLDNASYFPSLNLLLFKEKNGIFHEMMHMASACREECLFGFCRDGNYSLYEQGLLEGMTEYLACMAIGEKPSSYYFEHFVASMLSTLDGIFEPYFIPSYDKFVSIFPNKRDILSLMYGLDFYHEKIKEIDDDTDDVMLDRIENSVRGVIDSLIDIELSFYKSNVDRIIYADKFMDLISDKNIDCVVGDVFPDYRDYAYHAIKRRILRRR